MISEIHSDLIRGHINTFILKALFESDRYGYDICRDIEERSSGQYKLKQPTLYSCLRRLESQGYITSYWGGANALGGRRKYYTLTSQGRDLFVKNQTEWEYSRTVIDKLISERAFDISAMSPIGDGEYKQSSGGFDDMSESGDFDDENFLEEPAPYGDAVSETADTNGDAQIVDTTEAANSDDGTQEDATGFYYTEEPQEEQPVFTAEDVLCGTPVPELDEPATKEEQLFAEPDADDNKPVPEFTYYKFDPNEYDLSEKATSPTASFGGSYTGSVENESIRIKEYQPKSFFSFNSNDYSDDQYDYPEDMASEPEEKEAALTEIEETEPSNSGIKFDNKYIQPDNFENIERPAQINDAPHLYEEETDDILTERILKEYRNEVSFEHKSDIKVAPSEEELAKSYIDKEYQNLIGKIFGDADYYTAANIAPDNVTKIVKKNYSRINSFEEATATVTERKYYAPPVSAKKPEDKPVKKHSKELSENFSSSYYYFSNRLRLAHYGILFLIMAIETVAVFLVLDLVMKTKQEGSAVYYILALALAAVLPVVAIFPHIRKPDFKKRYTFNLTDSEVVRMLIFVNVLLVILAVNLFGYRVTVTNINNYLVGIVLPSILATNIPLSAVIFQLLYNTKKYAA